MSNIGESRQYINRKKIPKWLKKDTQLEKIAKTLNVNLN